MTPQCEYVDTGYKAVATGTARYPSGLRWDKCQLLQSITGKPAVVSLTATEGQLLGSSLWTSMALVISTEDALTFKIMLWDLGGKNS